MLLQLAGDEAVVAQKPNYLQDNTFAGKFNNNPFHSAIDAKGFVPIHPQRIYIRPSKENAENSPSFDINNLTIDGMHKEGHESFENIEKILKTKRKTTKKKVKTESSQDE